MDFFLFNILEAIFWFVCALFSVTIGERLRLMPQSFWQILSACFVLFGFSDVVESWYPVSFFEAGGGWLLVWKLLCIASFIALFLWYLVARMRKRI